MGGGTRSSAEPAGAGDVNLPVAHRHGVGKPAYGHMSQHLPGGGVDQREGIDSGFSDEEGSAFRIERQPEGGDAAIRLKSANPQRDRLFSFSRRDIDHGYGVIVSEGYVSPIF